MWAFTLTADKRLKSTSTILYQGTKTRPIILIIPFMPPEYFKLFITKTETAAKLLPSQIVKIRKFTFYSELCPLAYHPTFQTSPRHPPTLLHHQFSFHIAETSSTYCDYLICPKLQTCIVHLCWTFPTKLSRYNQNFKVIVLVRNKQKILRNIN